MPKKKTEVIEKTGQGEQTSLIPEMEPAPAESAPADSQMLTADDSTESLIAAVEPRQDGEENPTEAMEPGAGAVGEAQPGDQDETPEELQQDALAEDAGEWPDETPGLTLNGSFSGPLDIERRLEEEIAALDAEIAASADENPDNGQQQPEPEDEPDTRDEEPHAESPAPSPAPKVKRKTAKSAPPPEEDKVAPETPAVSSGRGSGKSAKTTQSPATFYQADFRHLDRDLTEPEKQEWNEIYASFRSQSILTGTVAGVDQNELPVRNSDGRVEMRVISSLVVVGYRVKILIPENAVWFKGEERSTFLMRGMIGATVDYVVINVDREGEVALASRALALVKRRRAFSGGRTAVKPGDVVDCSALVVGPKRCLVTCGGYDVPMRPSDMSYTSMLDMREHYRPGQELKARVLSHKPAQRELNISVKDATSNPFVGAERRHPVGSRRQAVITSKYKGGVFCTMADGTVCLCLYSNAHYDSDFVPGDNVIIFISQYNYKDQHIYGRIVSKW